MVSAQDYLLACSERSQIGQGQRHFHSAFTYQNRTHSLNRHVRYTFTRPEEGWWVDRVPTAKTIKGASKYDVRSWMGEGVPKKQMKGTKSADLC